MMENHESAHAEQLANLQRWLLNVITHPGGVNAAAAQCEHPATVEEIVAPSKSLSSSGRLQVYAHAYYARLVECLREEFPALAAVVGEETFAGFVMEYLQRYPSCSYTLAKLGANFPQFLAETRPADAAAEEIGWPEFLIDLSILERTYAEVFDGPGMEKESGFDARELSNLSPEVWPEVKLLPAPSLRLQAFRFPVHNYAAAVRRGEEPAFPAACDTYLVISRREYIVRTRSTSKAECDMLQGLCAGASVGEVVAESADSGSIPAEKLAQQLHAWFANWTRDFLFREIVLP